MVEVVIPPECGLLLKGGREGRGGEKSGGERRRGGEDSGEKVRGKGRGREGSGRRGSFPVVIQFFMERIFLILARCMQVV